MTAFNTLESIRETFRKANCFSVGWLERYDQMAYDDVVDDLIDRCDVYLSLPESELTDEEKRLIDVVEEWYS